MQSTRHHATSLIKHTPGPFPRGYALGGVDCTSNLLPFYIIITESRTSGTDAWFCRWSSPTLLRATIAEVFCPLELGPPGRLGGSALSCKQCQHEASSHTILKNGLQLETLCWILNIEYWILDTGYWILDTGYWILDTGYWILDIRSRTLCYTEADRQEPKEEKVRTDGPSASTKKR